MKFVGKDKSYTTSETGVYGKRKLRLSGGKQRSIEFSERLSNDPQTIIGQWISIIDKIFIKPKPGKPIGETQHRLRDGLGNAAWKILSKELREDREKWHEYWLSRLHPYDTSFSKFDEVKTGREYSRFLGERDPGTVNNLNGIAKNIQNHLFKEERPSKLGVQVKRNRPGLTTSRASAIATSNVDQRTKPASNSFGTETTRQNGFDFNSLRMRIDNPRWDQSDQDLYVANSDIAQNICTAEKCHRKNKNHWRFGTKEAGALLYQHYGNVFGSDRVGSDDKSNSGGLSREHVRESGFSGVLLLHDAVREFYKTRLRTTKKKNLEFVLPKNSAELFRIINFQIDNRITNDLIRLGRVLHYEASQSGDGEFALKPDAKTRTPPHVWQITEPELRKSYWFLSDGQSQIKRTEAFVRVWRNLTSQAARSLSYWADPNDLLYQDILDFSQNAKVFARAQQDNERLTTHLKLLFGSKSNLFKSNPTGTLLYAMNMLRIARNEIIHFRSRSQFTHIMNSKLKGSLINFGSSNKEKVKEFQDMFETAAGAAAKLYLDDRLEVVERHHDVLKGAWVTSFATNEQYEALLSSIINAEPVDTTLPKFNRVLSRIQGAGSAQIDDNRSLPGPASMQKLKTPSRKAKFIALKLVYEKPFCQWLDQKSSHAQLKQWIEVAANQATKGAKENSEKPNEAMVRSRAQERFGELPENATLADFLADLTSATAREMQVQDGYRSMEDNARDQALWIENFRCDVLGLAFCQFLRGENNLGTDFLLKLNENSIPTDAKAAKPEINLKDRESLAPEWANALYLILHLSPPDDASMLMHQLKKWVAVESKAQKETHTDHQVTENENDAGSITALLKIFDTYNSMHNAKFEGEGIDIDLQEFRDLYEDQTQFDMLFLDSDHEDERLAGTKRGLREMLRFGHQKVLMHIFKTNLVSREEVERSLDFETIDIQTQKSKIADLHARHEELHASAVATFGKNAKQDQPSEEKFDQPALKEYQQTVRDIAAYRETAKKVKLVSHVQLHRLMMRVIARLVDYAGLWERDLYFQSLAIMKLQQPEKTREDVPALLGWINRDYFVQGSKNFFKSGKLPPEYAQKNEAGNEPKNYAPGFWQLLRRFHNPRARQTRNDLAHFNILRTDDNDLNLTPIVQDTRNMMKYDRKLKNAVTKSIIEMMQQEGVELSWSLDGHNLSSVTTKSMDIQHLSFMQKQIGDWACDAEGLPKSIHVPYKNKDYENWKKKRVENAANISRRRYTSRTAQIRESRHSLIYLQMVRALFE